MKGERFDTTVALIFRSLKLVLPNVSAFVCVVCCSSASLASVALFLVNYRPDLVLSAGDSMSV